MDQADPVAGRGFQSALPRGERLYTLNCSTNALNFNPRSREGSDCILEPVHTHLVISIRAPARGATEGDCLMGLIYDISIRAPARGATQCGSDNRQRYRYFNPRSREGSDVFWQKWQKIFLPISIRAPARGATSMRTALCRIALFQSALPRGERPAGSEHPLL